jgi:hypothetical protein
MLYLLQLIINFYTIDEFRVNSFENRDYRLIKTEVNFSTGSKPKFHRNPSVNFRYARDTLRDTLLTDMFVLSAVCKEFHKSNGVISEDGVYSQCARVKFHFWQT